MGWEAARRLQSQLAGIELPPPQLVPPRQVVVRTSTDTSLVGRDPAVAKTIGFIRDHVGEALTIDDVAATVGLGRRTLERRCRQATGRSILQEIQRARTLHAKHLLTTTDCTISDIARRCGISDDRLTQIFLAQQGCTPAQFRRDLREQH